MCFKMSVQLMRCGVRIVLVFVIEFDLYVYGRFVSYRVLPNVLGCLCFHCSLDIVVAVGSTLLNIRCVDVSLLFPFRCHLLEAPASSRRHPVGSTA